MTKKEYERPPIIQGPYWVIIIGGEPGWTAKMYPADRWQKVIDSLPDIQFVQLGMSGHPYPHLKNVTDYIGKTEDRHTGIRDLFNIFRHAQGSVGLVSMHMHLSAVFNNACVVVAGAREPAWFTHYFGHQYLQTNGVLPCAIQSACWKCDVKGCKDQTDGVPKCVDVIQPEDIVRAIMRYYDGGRLEMEKKIKNDFFKNITKTEKPFARPESIDGLTDAKLAEYGMKWDSTNIGRRDWQLIEEAIKDCKAKTALEFGSGLSTLLMQDKVKSVTSYETDPDWLNNMEKWAKKKKVKIKLWDGHSLDLKKSDRFDFAFVDGPGASLNTEKTMGRKYSIKAASEHADAIVIHDAWRRGKNQEMQWQVEYVEKDFKLVKTGGRSHLWIRKEDKNEKSWHCKPINGKGLVRLVSTSRGWEGAQRSTTHIMRMLCDNGYVVEYVPFHGKYELGKGISGEYKKNLDERVVIRDWSRIPERCDVLFVYADDYIWEFKQPELADVFSNPLANRKVMMLNYRRGGVGQVEWTKGWDSYGFLNSTQEEELLKILPKAKTWVLPPCTDLAAFFQVKPKYAGPLRIVRHNSQGDTKFAKDFGKELEGISRARKDVEFHMMPGPSFVERSNLTKYPRNKPPIPEFLPRGNLFYYSLPEGYFDMGPRVVLEAMASGLPVIADNWGGSKDRVTKETGWLCDKKEQYPKIIKSVTSKELKAKGETARQRARKHFIPERWMDRILGIDGG